MDLRLKRAKYRQLLLLLGAAPVLLFAQLREPENLLTGAEQPGRYLPLLHGKSVAVVAHPASRTGDQHLVDFLREKNVELKCVFAPEHGFRGTASAGEKVDHSRDKQSGLPIVSLYGTNKRPQPEHLADIDVVLFDLQDVGARFYTYVSTLTYMMEALAGSDKLLIVLDRPNPNGYYVDGPVLEPEFRSFVGLHPVPVVHGMTLGEYAQMLNGQKWLEGGKQCRLEVVTCQNWDHGTRYPLPVKPSPNLPNTEAIALYPSLCFFEGTQVSVGRGTDRPFQVIGAPWFSAGDFEFVPTDREGARNPKYEGQRCRGIDLRDFAQHYLEGLGELYLYWLTEAYAMAPEQKKFFTSYFDTLAGTDKLRKAIISGHSPEDIRESWTEDLAHFREIRKKYLLYEDYDPDHSDENAARSFR